METVDICCCLTLSFNPHLVALTLAWLGRCIKSTDTSETFALSDDSVVRDAGVTIHQHITCHNLCFNLLASANFDGNHMGVCIVF